MSEAGEARETVPVIETETIEYDGTPAFILAREVKGHREYLFGSLTEDPKAQELLQWFMEHREVKEGARAYQRLQIEKFIWDRRDLLTRHNGTVIDIGSDVLERRWLGPGYRTLDVPGLPADITGDLMQGLPFEDGSVAAVLCTEVLEHVVNPFRAVEEVYRVLAPGGLAIFSSPFIWPWHGCGRYPDYWRLTWQGWHMVLQPFGKGNFKLYELKWTAEGSQLWRLCQRFEVMGFTDETFSPVGYVVEARKP